MPDAHKSLVNRYDYLRGAIADRRATLRRMKPGPKREAAYTHLRSLEYRMEGVISHLRDLGLLS